MRIGPEFKKAGKEYVDSVKNAGKETWHSKDAGELLGNILMVQPAKLALNIFGITTKTALKISGILALNTLKLAGKGIAMLPIFPFAALKKRPFDSKNYKQMAEDAHVTFAQQDVYQAPTTESLSNAA